MFQYQRWKVNLRILDINEIKTLPYIPMSYPFIERLIRTIRNELVDQTLFLHADGLQEKLEKYQRYLNNKRSHKSLNAAAPGKKYQQLSCEIISINNYTWESHCNGLFQLLKVA